LQARAFCASADFHCRSLDIQSYPLDLDRLQAPDLNHLAYHGRPPYDGPNYLHRRDIIAVSRFTCLKSLKLLFWTTWDDPSTLLALPLEALVSSSPELLSCLVGVGGWKSLKAVAIAEGRDRHGRCFPDISLEGPDFREPVHVDPDTVKEWHF